MQTRWFCQIWFLFVLGSPVFFLASCQQDVAVTPAIDRLEIEGTIREISALPEPLEAPYPDCRFTVRVEVEHILQGEMMVDPTILVALPGFTRRLLEPEAAAAVGGLVRLRLLPFHQATDAIRTVQLIDDIDSLELDLYASTHCDMIASFSTGSFREPVMPELDQRPALAPVPSLPAAEPALSTVDPALSTVGPALSTVNPAATATPLPGGGAPLPGGAALLPGGAAPHPGGAAPLPGGASTVLSRNAQLQHDLQDIEARIASYGPMSEWEASNRALSKSLQAELKKNQGPLWLDRGISYASPWHLVKTWDEAAEPELRVVETFRLIQEGFNQLGCDLILVPIPDRDSVAVDLFVDHVPPLGIQASARLKAHRHLLKAGLETIDVLPALKEGIQTRNDFAYYETTDVHPGSGVLEITADHIATRLQRYPLMPSATNLISQSLSYTNLLYPLHEPYTQAVSRVCRQIRQQDGSILQLSDQSPLLVIGDSYAKVPRSYGVAGAAIAEQIAYATEGVVPSSFRRPAGTMMMGKYLAREPLSYVQNRKVCLFVFNETYLFTRRADFVPIDFIQKNAAHSRDHARFFDRSSRRVVKYNNLTGFYNWSSSAPDAAPVGKTKFLVDNPPESRRIQVPVPLQAGQEYMMFFSVTADRGTTWKWYGGGKEPVAIDVLNTQNYLLVPFVAGEGGFVGLEAPAHCGRARIYGLEIKALAP